MRAKMSVRGCREGSREARWLRGAVLTDDDVVITRADVRYLDVDVALV